MRLPNGPNSSPRWLVTLRTLRWIFSPLEVLEARSRRYGDNFRIGSQLPTLIYLSTPEAIEAVFTAKPEQLNSAAGNEILKPLLGAQSVVLLDGERHQRHRQLLMPPFHGDRMRSYGQQIVSIVTEVLQSKQAGQPFAVRPVMQEISLRVILSAVFGLHQGERYEKLRTLLSEMLDGIGTPIGFLTLFYDIFKRDWGPWGRFIRLRAQVNDLLYAEIRDRRNHPDPSRSDILALLLSARDQAGEALSDEELRDELITLLFAGHETTASALAWALYWIAYLPEIRSKLLAEIDSVPNAADPTTIARLPYLTAVCQETLRLYPIAISVFPRVVRQDMELAGYDLIAGTFVMPSIYLAHQREAVYPEPKRFRPERFLERQFSPYEYLPFGGGDRRCIGAAFALFEMKLVLFTILSTMQFELVNPQPLKPVRRGLTMAPPNHLRMKITKKLASTNDISTVATR